MIMPNPVLQTVNSRNVDFNAIMLDEVASQYKLLRCVSVPNDYEHAEYKHYFFINSEYLASGWTRDRIVDEMNALGVPCYQGSCSEVYLEKAFDGTNWRPKERLHNAKELGETSIMMLVHPTLKEAEMKKSCDALSKIISKAQV